VSTPDLLHDVVADQLRDLGLEHEVLACDPELADTARFCAHYGIELEDSANAILVAARKPIESFALCLLLATTRLDVNRRVREVLGAKKVSFASADETVARTGQEIGGVTVLGMPADVPILVDAAVLARTRVVVGGGNRRSKLLLPTTAFVRIPGVRVIEGLARPVPATP
jgi:prolyl-tRNA editing enzyme YbaK/EbsC (Cys-tRNA(Pro) deacylase)